MELRHLRYFVAVVEAGSFTTAAEHRLHTSQPSLSRQIRDLEYRVGTELLSRSVHGAELTAAGKAFLEHARLALMQVAAAGYACANEGTHKTALIRRGLAKRPRFHLHFTPTGASWLNLVERWFALLTEKQIRRGGHRGTRELE